jgi:hypothetical protein
MMNTTTRKRIEPRFKDSDPGGAVKIRGKKKFSRRTSLKDFSSISQRDAL